MYTNKIDKKKERKEDIIILDNGIDTENIIDILRICCTISFMPFRF